MSKINLKKAKIDSKKYICPTYGERSLLFTHGSGTYVYDNNNKKYLDFLSGIAVNSLGHADKNLSKAIFNQAKKIIHTSNLYYTEPQIKVAEILSKQFKNGKVFFCNSGAEANEAAIKLTRKYFYSLKQNKYEIITFKNSFHGRTLATITATGQKKYQEPFKPLIPGFKYAEFNNIDSVKKLINKKTAGIMIEVIQCEGGINIAKKGFIKQLKSLCEKNKILLIIDEVQTGVGRTGKFFGFENYNIKPDIISLAKGIAGGLPMGAMIANKKIADAFAPGDHASTFGGNPLVCAGSLEVLKKVTKKAFLKSINDKGHYFCQYISKKINPELIKEIRNMGLMIGIEFTKEIGGKILTECQKNGLLINSIKNKILRVAPPLNVTKKDLKNAADIIIKVCKGKEM